MLRDQRLRDVLLCVELEDVGVGDVLVAELVLLLVVVEELDIVIVELELEVL